MPSLKERIHDIPLIANQILLELNAANNLQKQIDIAGLNKLEKYDYPGNIRELKSIIDRMVVLSNDGLVTKEGIPILYNIHKKYETNKRSSTENKFNKIIPFKQYKSEAEAEYLQWVLEQTGGNVAEAARQLEISTRQLFNKIKEYTLQK